MRYKFFFTFSLMMLLLTMSSAICKAQVVVDNKNISEDNEIEFIQLLYYIDKGTYKPVYFLDIGETEPEISSSTQRITVDTVAINSNMSPALILNKLFKAGWEYMGDAMYISLPLRNDWHIFTLRRRRS